MSDREMTLDQFIDNTDSGQIFSIDFIKRSDNTQRTMQARRGVRKGVKGVGQAYDPKSKNLLTVYDMAKMDPKAPHNQGKTADEMTRGAFRNINLSALVALRMNGNHYNWDNTAQKFIQAA